MPPINTPAATPTPTPIAAWATLGAVARHLSRWVVPVAMVLALLQAAALLSLVLLRVPLAALFALATGTLARILGQRLKVKRLKDSLRAADLATFSFSGQSIDCNFNHPRIVRYINSWFSKIAAALSAGLVCLAAVELSNDRIGFLSVHPLSLLPAQILAMPWLNAAVKAGCMALPVVAVFFFLWTNGPERRWSGQVMAAIEARAAAVLDVLGDREIDGLEAGMEVLGQELGLWQGRPYRAAMAKHLSSHTREAVLKPEATRAMEQAITELARQDLNSLGAALGSYQKARGRLESFQLLASLLRDPIHEARAEELSRELEQIPVLAAHRQWEQCQRQAGRLEFELDEIQPRLRCQLAAGPPVMLSPGVDPYRILGINTATPTASIKKLRLRLAQLYHPDIGDSTANSAKMAELNAAYDSVMKDREMAGR
jgi:hypothetical protein